MAQPPIYSFQGSDRLILSRTAVRVKAIHPTTDFIGRGFLAEFYNHRGKKYMSHSKDFFKDEIRNGFYIPSALKQAWACYLDVLHEIDVICKRHDINYYADWGTFLGAVRHGGFVPWDDDLDICMKRDDYIRFRQVADEELPSSYVIHDYERKKNHWLFLSRVVSNKQICFDEAFLENNYNFPWLASVDIFVKDYLYNDKETEKKRCDEVLRMLSSAEPILETERDKAISIYKKAEKKMAEVRPEDSDFIGQIFPWILKNGGPRESKKFYEDIVYLPFEDTFIPVPACYNKVLSMRYGDYNVVRKGVAAHEFPSFEAQRKAFEKETDARLPSFTFKKEIVERPSVDRSGSSKTLAKECVDELYNFYDRILIAAKSSDRSSMLELLANSQQLAVDLGTMIEQLRGEDDPHAMAIVHVLEDYCENIFLFSQTINEQVSSTHVADTPALNNLKSSLDLVSLSLTEHMLNRKEILFLTVGAEEWKSFERLYMQEKIGDDSTADIYVVPLPLFFKDIFGNIKNKYENKGSENAVENARDIPAYMVGYPEELKLTDYLDYNLALHCPDRIYIQNPYDNENPVLSVPVDFYARNLRLYTDELIYIPLGPVSEFTDSDSPDYIMMKYYITAPGAVYADKIYAQSENIRKKYICILSDFVKDTIAEKDYWNDIVVDIQNAETLTCKLSKAMSEHTDKTGQRKRILFCIAMYEFYENEDIFESAIDSRLKTLIEASDKIDFEVCIYPDYSHHSPGLGWNNFYETVKAITLAHGKKMVSYSQISSASATFIYDAYYGSSTPFVQEFVLCKKPVMIANLTV